jgi:hypothetical protein
MASNRGKPGIQTKRNPAATLDLSGLSESEKRQIYAMASRFKLGNSRSSSHEALPSASSGSHAAPAQRGKTGSHAAPAQRGKTGSHAAPVLDQQSNPTTQGRSPSSDFPPLVSGSQAAPAQPTTSVQPTTTLGLPPTGKRNNASTSGGNLTSQSRSASSMSIQQLDASPTKRRNTRSRNAANSQPTTSTAEPIDVDNAPQLNAPAPQQRAALPNPPSNLVVIFDNITNMTKKFLEPELCRVAPWLQPKAIDFMRSGGMRVKCQRPADADRLLKREDFPADAFGGRFTVHRPGQIDASRPISQHLDKDLRSVVTTRLPLCYDAADLREILDNDYVEEIRDIPPKDLNRPPLRIIVFKTKVLRDDAIENGMSFFNRRVRVRPLRSPVLPLFCRKCSGYGHTAVDCKAKAFTCAKCSGVHDTATCNIQRRDAQCPNCPLEACDHFATYRGCPAFKDATKKEIERRQARLNTKLAARDRRRNDSNQPNNRPVFSNAPAPIRDGVSFSAATQPAFANAPQQQPQLQQQQPPQLQQQQQQAPQPDLRMIWTALIKIQADLEAMRKEQSSLRAKVVELEVQQTRFEERQDGFNQFDDDDELMDVGDSSHNDSQNNDQHHA